MKIQFAVVLFLAKIVGWCSVYIECTCTYNKVKKHKNDVNSYAHIRRLKCKFVEHSLRVFDVKCVQRTCKSSSFSCYRSHLTAWHCGQKCSQTSVLYEIWINKSVLCGSGFLQYFLHSIKKNAFHIELFHRSFWIEEIN